MLKKAIVVAGIAVAALGVGAPAHAADLDTPGDNWGTTLGDNWGTSLGDDWATGFGSVWG
ncbi:hypothetical protein [Marinitenerispora sediminis]|uniref:5'-nucleotidase n=1 Tax=Marinitenerispora sediminis TaxID=1931232 RepID=A0A368T2E5_9ACTN|nr:hypothetical protein [Marinitenerispora sediminis]RCV48787.1 hypothetical protein DEF28_22605 [Marinitenerispora sediminis]RCV50719.1 hypothetical protein DEF23_21630 [Marinitenerispora sediminis]RCV55625.1 hypothetical protein DEF24_17700 [Marinitenerispora sediminis]